MPVTKRTEIDDVRMNPQTGYLGWRVTSIIEEDGVEIGRTYHRHSLEADYADFPGSPAIPAEVAAVVQLNRLHSQQMKDAARARREAARQAGPPAAP